MERPGLLAKFALFVGLIGLAALPVGALGHRFGLWSHFPGFALVFTGIVLAVIVVVLGVATLVFSVTRHRPVDRTPAVVGIVASVLVLGWMGIQFTKAISSVRTNDIATDRDDPPAFDHIVSLRGVGANPLDYTEEEAQLQADGYPDIAGIRTSGSRADSLAKAVAIARELGWEIVNEDPDAGLVEATDTTFWFGFVDDIAIRTRDDGSDIAIDLRSVSRVGLSDLGVNAARIRSFLERWDE